MEVEYMILLLVIACGGVVPIELTLLLLALFP